MICQLEQWTCSQISLEAQALVTPGSTQPPTHLKLVASTNEPDTFSGPRGKLFDRPIPVTLVLSSLCIFSVPHFKDSLAFFLLTLQVYMHLPPSTFALPLQQCSMSDNYLKRINAKSECLWLDGPKHTLQRNL